MRVEHYVKDNGINPLQVYFLIFLTQFGTGILSLPREVTQIAGEDGWISVLLATILNMIVAGIAVKLVLRYKGKTMVEINRELLGNFFGTLVSMLYFFYFFGIAVFLLRSLADLVVIWVLASFSFQTALYLAVPVLVYLTRNGIKVMARLFNLYFYHLLPLSIIIFWPLWEFEPRLVFPFFTEGLMPVIKGLKVTSSAFFGFEAILMLNPFLKKPEKTMLAVQAATLTTGIIYTITVFALTAYFGVQELQFQLWPTIYVARTITIAFLERLDIFIDILWIIVSFTSLAMYYYLASFSLARIFNKQEHKNFTIILVIPLIVGSFIPQNLYQTMALSNNLSQVGLILAGLFPLLALIVGFIKQKKGGMKRGT
jgi:spore germination protein